MKRGNVEAYRFICMLLVLLLHLFQSNTAWGNGYLAVEYFFILSGFLLTRTCESARRAADKPADVAVSFLKSRIKRLFPLMFVVTLFTMVFLILTHNLRFEHLFSYVFIHIWDFTFLQMTGVGLSAGPLVIASWYLSAYLIVGYFITYFLMRNKEGFCFIAAPMSILIIYGLFAHAYGWMGECIEYVIMFIPNGILRAIAGMSAGVLCYYTSEKLRTVTLSQGKKWLLNFVEPVGMALLVYVAYVYRKTMIDFSMIPVLMSVIVVAFAVETVWSKIFAHKIFLFLGAISLPMYLSHWLVSDVLKYFFSFKSYYVEMAVTLSSCFAFSTFLLYLPGIWGYLVRRKDKTA